MYYDDSKSAIAYKIILPNKEDNKLDDLVIEQIIKFYFLRLISLKIIIFLMKNEDFEIFLN
jgi:hypothetical protein